LLLLRQAKEISMKNFQMLILIKIQFKLPYPTQHYSIFFEQ